MAFRIFPLSHEWEFAFPLLQAGGDLSFERESRCGGVHIALSHVVDTGDRYIESVQ